MAKGNKKTLLVIGDRSDSVSYMKFNGWLNSHKYRYLEPICINYEQLDKKRLPRIKNGTVIVYLFFPFKHWNKHIEHSRYQGVYGCFDFYNKFRAFWSEVNQKLHKFYANKKLHFINPPLSAYLRDKELTKEILIEGGIKVPEGIFTRDYEEIINLINRGKKLFLKVRYGSMGKGLTYLEKGSWKTNFRFKRKKIKGKHSDCGWTFIDVTNNKDFLKELLSKDIIVEEAIGPALIGEKKFDLRVYTCFGEALFIYARSNTKDAVTTSISQGAKGESPRFVKKIPSETIKKVKKIAIKATKVVGLNIAGVDVLLDKELKKVYINEINAFPGFPGAKKFNLSKRIINKIKNQNWD